jgi:hypothetical protein
MMMDAIRAPRGRSIAQRAALLAALAATGCEPTGGTLGELGQGRFYYVCGVDDLFCSEQNAAAFAFGEDEPPVPERIALGASFGLTFASHEAGGGRAEVAIESFADGASFRAMQPGFVGFFADGGGGRVVDLMHLEVVSPTDLSLVTRDASLLGSVSLTEPLQIAAVPLGSGGETLFGSVPAFWASSDLGVVAISSPSGVGAPRAGLARLTPLAQGTTTVEVAVGGLVATIEVTVPEGAL